MIQEENILTQSTNQYLFQKHLSTQLEDGPAGRPLFYQEAVVSGVLWYVHCVSKYKLVFTRRESSLKHLTNISENKLKMLKLLPRPHENVDKL